MKIKDWQGQMDLVVAPLDDFHLVLGVDFLRKTRAFPTWNLYAQ